MKPEKGIGLSRIEEEALWVDRWNEAGLALARKVMDETDTSNEALFLLDITKTMIENAVKAVEIETKKKGR